jgi:two-component system, sensor histidine kinase and response regulator
MQGTAMAHGESTPVEILIVEDELIVARDLRDTLEDLGYKVVAMVASGEDAVTSARLLRPAAILMDIHLAGDIDGIEAAEQIRRERDIPILYLTAHSNDDALRRATATEPFAYIVKPFTAPELRCAIEVALRKHQLMTQLSRTVTEQHGAEDELRRRNTELDAFSASVAHDLRAPLRGIDGFSQILLEDHGASLGPDGLGHLVSVRQAARRMHGLIDDLLRLSRTASAELHRGPIDLSRLARDAVTRLRAAEPGRAVTVDIADAITVSADERLLAIVLDNLLGNAWKFTSKRDRATIEVGTVRHGEAEVCFVRDDGAGFDPGSATRLFGAFERLHPASEFEGTGLGLAIVRRVIERHGGRIWAEGADGAGATFYFVL